MPARQHSNVRLPANLLRAIGHVAALWAQLEYIIDGTTRESLDQPGAPEIDTALILPFGKRLSLLTQLVDLFLAAEDRELASEFISETRQAQHLRDLIVHGSVAGSGQIRRGRKVYWFRRVRWERPARIKEKRSMTADQVEEIASQISDLVSVAGIVEIMMWAEHRASRGKRD